MNGISHGSLTNLPRTAEPRAGSAVRRLALASATAGLAVAAAGCAAGGAGVASHSARVAHPAAAARAAGASHRPGRTAGRALAVTSARVTAARVNAPSGAPAPGYRGPHFSTPQAAMRYLAAAYNHHNATELHHVTTPTSYRDLQSMRSEAVNLRLRSCVRNPGRGDYTCFFTHDYPASLNQPGHGASTFIVGPALNPGWYMYTLAGCG